MNGCQRGASHAQLRSVELLCYSLSGGFRRLTMQSYDIPKGRFTFLNFLGVVKIAECPLKFGGVDDVIFFLLLPSLLLNLRDGRVM